MPVEVAPPQDLGEYKHEPRSPQWGAIQPFSIVPDADRLRKPSQLVTIKNIGIEQTIIIRDRNEKGQELRAGESREIDMIAEDIAYFLREQGKKRVGADGKERVYPIVVEGVSADAVRQSIEKWTEEEKAAQADRFRQAARDQLVELFRDAGISSPTVAAPQPGEGTQVRRAR